MVGEVSLLILDNQSTRILQENMYVLWQKNCVQEMHTIVILYLVCTASFLDGSHDLIRQFWFLTLVHLKISQFQNSMSKIANTS